MGRLRVASALFLAILQESLSIDVSPGPAADAGNTVPAPGPPSSPAAPASAPDLKDLESEVQRLKARSEQEATALQIADAAAVGAMQKSSAEVKTRLAAQHARQASTITMVHAQNASASAEARANVAEAHLASQEAEASQAQEAAADALRASGAKLIQAQNATAAAVARAEKAESHAEALRSALIKAERNGSFLGSFGARLCELPEQKSLAVAAVVIGSLSVIGPTSLINFVLATAGSVFGGLIFASGVSYFIALHRLSSPTGMSSPRWPNFLDDLMQGRGSHVAYAIWLVWALLGMARYLSGCRCQIVKWVPVVNLYPSGEVEAVEGTSLKAPLINGREEYSRQRGASSDPSQSSGRPSAPLLPSSRQASDSRQSSDNLRPSDPSLPSAAFHPPPLPGSQSAGPRPSPRPNGETPRSARSSNGAGGRTGFPKAQPSKSSGIFARMSKSFQDFSNRDEGAAPGTMHSSGRPGGAASHV